MDVKTITKIKCFHCGEACDEQHPELADKAFCCEGCKTVYEILNENNLCNYYAIHPNPGVSLKTPVTSEKYTFLENNMLKDKLISFTDGKQTHVTFYIPQMHCSSCIWLLENFHKINPGVVRSQVNFPKKEVTIVYNEPQTTIRNVVEHLSHIGYEPHLSLDDLENKKTGITNIRQYLKVGIAGFCFGNIMMLSFPEYFSDGEIYVKGLTTTFGYLNLILSLPAFFYCSTDFFVSALKSIRQGLINIDGPISIAILVTFLRSVYEIISGTGTGYMDSMSGIVFFMLVGRVFQEKTFRVLSFERDYKSYFPISVTLKTDVEKSVAISELKAGDRIIIRNNELIPADAFLLKGDANIDYSFVSGESLPVQKTLGEIIYAGGKQSGSSIELEVIKEVAQSYLTRLWNSDVFHKKQETKTTFINTISNYFSIVVFAIALGAGIYWFPTDAGRALNAVTAVLIVACPCALLLSATFTNGATLRVLGHNKLYLKSSGVIEKLATIDTIVFDKTGTITSNGDAEVEYDGRPLSLEEKDYLSAVVSHSTHPLSQTIYKFLAAGQKYAVSNFFEHPYQGIEAQVATHSIKIGSLSFVGIDLHDAHPADASRVYVSIDGEHHGCFHVKNKYRKGFYEMAEMLKKKYVIFVLSGDNDAERKALSKTFDPATLIFKQSPHDKLHYIQSLQKAGHKVLMVGDGLNDAGALKQSNVGIAVSDDTNNFSPACDAIMDGNKLKDLKKFLWFSIAGRRVIIASFIISLVYNLGGIFFSVQGTLQPIIAAILMPLSTITIVLFTTGMMHLIGKVKFD